MYANLIEYKLLIITIASSYNFDYLQKRIYTHANISDDLIPNKHDKTECYCRVSSLVKAFIFLAVILAATVGLVIFFLNSNNSTRDIVKDTVKDVADTNIDNISPTIPEPRIEVSENLRFNEGETSKTDNINKPELTIKSSNIRDPKKHGNQVNEKKQSETTNDNSVQEQYEKVLDGFDDGEYTFDVKTLLEPSGTVSKDNEMNKKLVINHESDRSTADPTDFTVEPSTPSTEPEAVNVSESEVTMTSTISTTGNVNSVHSNTIKLKIYDQE